MLKCFKESYHYNLFPQDYFFQSYTYVLRNFVYAAMPNRLVFITPLQADDKSQMSHALEEIPAWLPELPSTYRQL